MRKNSGVALLLASCLVTIAEPALALQAFVKQVDRNPDGSRTYHFSIKLDQGESLNPGESKGAGDFVTVYNFYGLIEGSQTSPAGWTFSSEQSGRTPMLNGYPMVLPVDVPNTPNLTWTVTRTVAAGSEIDGFTARTRVSTIVEGQYSAEVTRLALVVQGAPMAARTSKQALIGFLPTPSFLMDAK